jgi:hypothetical protein
LGVTEETVDTHIASIFSQLDVFPEQDLGSGGVDAKAYSPALTTAATF